MWNNCLRKSYLKTDMYINMLLKWYFQKIRCFYDTRELYIIM